MPEVGDEQAQEEDLPDAQVARRAQHEGLVEREDEVHVGELVEDDGLARGDGRAEEGAGGGG